VAAHRRPCHPGRGWLHHDHALNEKEVTAWATAHGIEGDIPALARRDEIQQLVQDAIDDYNKGVDPPEQVKKFRILDSDLSEEKGEITPTLKVKRNIVSEEYKTQFDEMYEDGAPDRGAFSRPAS
jgi:long-chain acyl-CoA synthetase